MIAGYIDIIMQKKRPIHGEVPEDEDEPVIVELEVDPQRYVCSQKKRNKFLIKPVLSRAASYMCLFYVLLVARELFWHEGRIEYLVVVCESPCAI